MKGYKFNLQRLLDIREEQEEDSKIKFKEARLEKEIVEQELDRLNNDYRKVRFKN